MGSIFEAGAGVGLAGSREKPTQLEGGDRGHDLLQDRKCPAPTNGAISLDLRDILSSLSGPSIFLTPPPSSLEPPRLQHCRTFQFRVLKASRES